MSKTGEAASPDHSAMNAFVPTYDREKQRKAINPELEANQGYDAHKKLAERTYNRVKQTKY